MNRSEKILCTVILALMFFVLFAHRDIKKDYNEKALKRQLMFKQFLTSAEVKK